MISLLPFQIEASTAIANKYRAFVFDEQRPTKRGYGRLPFYQSLQALTGAGKTPILADAITQMRMVETIEPVVMWVSMAKPVVEQTLINFSDGGKYQHLIEGFTAMALASCTAAEIKEASSGLLLIGTVGTFNIQDKSRGDRRIFGMREDDASISLWDALKQRQIFDGKRRPLFVVYDEGHELTDSQAELLLELVPEALIFASATPKLPGKLNEILEALRFNGYDNDDLTTSISSTAVVEAELVKREVQLGGYMTAEEVAISAMLDDYEVLLQVAVNEGVPFTPKCIYVCNTNIPGDEDKPFESRSAPPIKIWRYLVEQRGIDPTKIAIYCDLKTSSAHPLPFDCNLFKGDAAYSKFMAGGYKHIIFNLSLQRGWDDPECYLAYVDKSMGSDVQVEQLIGRVLRQPGVQYYSDSRLNTCGFYIHVDEAGVFRNILINVQKKLAQDMPSVAVVDNRGPNRTTKAIPPRVDIKLPAVYIDMAAAAEAVEPILNEVGGYGDTSGLGRIARTSQVVGQIEESAEIEWVEGGEGMPVQVQWLLRRLIDQEYPAAKAVCDMSDARFYQRIQIGSRAAKQLERQARALVAMFLQHARVSIFPGGRKVVGDSMCDTANCYSFRNSVHEFYSGLNKDEFECALALDRLGWTWQRNSSQVGFGIPILSPGNKRNFFPDFIVWTNTAIWLIEPKGEHLVRDAAGRKLFSIEQIPGELPLHICMITQGTWDKNFDIVNANGVTAWRLRLGIAHGEWFEDIDQLLQKIVGVKP